MVGRGRVGVSVAFVVQSSTVNNKRNDNCDFKSYMQLKATR